MQVLLDIAELVVLIERVDEAVAERMSWCVAQEYNKGAYQLVTNPDTLKQTNPKRTT